MARKKSARPAAQELSPEATALLAEGYEVVSGGAGEPWHGGEVFVGKYEGIRDSHFRQDDGEFAKLVDLKDGDGMKTYRCPTVLANRLDNVSPGDDVRIECLGKIKLKGGRTAWDFSVLVKRNSPRPAPKMLASDPVIRGAGGRRKKSATK